MSRKFKCNDCHTEHGGFHLCLGVIPLPERKPQTFRSLAEKSEAIQRRRREGAAARNAQICAAYDNGMPLKQIAREFNLNRDSIRKVIRKHKQQKENAA